MSVECDHHRNPIKSNLYTAVGPEAQNDTDPMVTYSGVDSVSRRDIGDSGSFDSRQVENKEEAGTVGTWSVHRQRTFAKCVATHQSHSSFFGKNLILHHCVGLGRRQAGPPTWEAAAVWQL